MRIDTNLLELATALYDEAAAEVGEGPEAERLAAAALSDLLGRSRLAPPRKPMVRHVRRFRAPAPRIAAAG